MAKRKARETSALLINESPLQVLPSLAVAVGLNEAMILQQVHFWLQQSSHIFEGEPWIYNTYEEWEKQFPFWGLNTLKRAIYQLEALGVLLSTARFNRNPIDKSKWYTINYRRLNDFMTPTTTQDGSSTTQDGSSTPPATTHLGSLDDPSWVAGRPILGRLPENPSETPAEIPSPQTPPPAGEGPDAVAGGEDENALATFPPVLRRMPWDKPVPPEIAACPLCDTHGFVEVWDAQNTLVLLRCPHDTVRLRACAARQGYELEREDLPRSREPPALPQEGGPAP